MNKSSEMLESSSVGESPASSIAAAKKGISIKEAIIYSTEVLEDEVEEVEEIVEIIEEIEEIEEIVEEEEVVEAEEGEEEEEEIVEERSAAVSGRRPAVARESREVDEDSHGDSAGDDDLPPRFKSTSRHQKSAHRRSYERKKKVVAYDADEDWEEEDGEQQQIASLRAKRLGKNNSVEAPLAKNNHSLNGKRSAGSRGGGDEYSSSTGRSNAEPVYKASKTRPSTDYSTSRRANDSTGINEIEREDDEEDEDENNQHEIVKSAENNLVYTVLGSKKSSQTSQPRSKKDTSQNQESGRYMKMERLDDDTLPAEGTIYYEDENMDTVYVAESMNQGDDEHYQYEGHPEEQEDQDWEETNEGNSENHEEEGPPQQDQIFLHEDEDGQLYFKDDNGTLQPVYLTADGNYAIAENSSDEQEAQESTNNRQIAASPASSIQAAKNYDDDGFTVPDLDSAASSSNPNDPDNEDNTVTISLIISEDENGQKRTQVIIPTSDNLKCELCAKSFKTSFQLLRHNRLKHAREEDITTRNFPCDLCPKRYSDQNTLARHRKTHIGDRPFGCLECGKSFPTSTALRRHLTQHNPQSRPLPCIYCGRRFLEKSALTKHEQSHLAGDQRTHTCDICHKSFLQAADLSLHKKNHDPDKKFDCEVCGREFNRLNNLQRHMMVHKQKQGQNQEILACDVCGITYKFMSSLTRHMVTSHMNPEKLRQQAEEQRKKRENNYRRYLENRKMYETQHTGTGYGSGGKRMGGYRSSNDNDEDTA